MRRVLSTIFFFPKEVWKLACQNFIHGVAFNHIQVCFACQYDPFPTPFLLPLQYAFLIAMFISKILQHKESLFYSTHSVLKLSTFGSICHI